MKKLILSMSSLFFCMGMMAQEPLNSNGSLAISLQASLTSGDTKALESDCMLDNVVQLRSEGEEVDPDTKA